MCPVLQKNFSILTLFRERGQCHLLPQSWQPSWAKLVEMSAFFFMEWYLSKIKTVIHRYTGSFINSFIFITEYFFAFYQTQLDWIQINKVTQYPVDRSFPHLCFTCASHVLPSLGPCCHVSLFLQEATSHYSVSNLESPKSHSIMSQRVDRQDAERLQKFWTYHMLTWLMTNDL